MEGITVPFRFTIEATENINKFINELKKAIADVQNNIQLDIEAGIVLDTTDVINKINKLSLDISKYKLKLPLNVDSKVMETVSKSAAKMFNETKFILKDMIDQYNKKVVEVSRAIQKLSKLKYVSPEQKRNIETILSSIIKEVEKTKGGIESIVASFQTTGFKLGEAIKLGRKEDIEVFYKSLKNTYDEIIKLNNTMLKSFTNTASKIISSIRQYSMELGSVSGTEIIAKLAGIPTSLRGNINQAVGLVHHLASALGALRAEGETVRKLFANWDFTGMSKVNMELNVVRNKVTGLISTIAELIEKEGPNISFDRFTKEIQKLQNEIKQVVNDYRKLVDNQLKAELSVLKQGEGLKENMVLLGNIAEQASVYKQNLISVAQKISMGSNLLENQDKFYSILLNLAKTGVDIEAEKVAELIKSSDIYSKMISYLNSLIKSEKEYASAVGDSLAGIRGRKTLIEEQLRVMKSLYVTSPESIDLEKIIQTTNKLKEVTAFEKLRENLINVANTVESKPVQSIKKLITSIYEFELASGKSFDSTKSNVDSVVSIVNKLLKTYKELSRISLPTETIVKYKKEILDALKLAGTAMGSSKTVEFASLNKISTEAEYAKIQAQKEIISNIEKIVALQIAGIEPVKNLIALEKKYVEAKLKGVNIDEYLLTLINDKKAAMNGLVTTYEKLNSLSVDAKLLPETQLEQLKSAKKVLDLLIATAKKSNEAELKAVGVSLPDLEQERKLLLDRIAAKTQDIERTKALEAAENNYIQAVKNKVKMETEVRNILEQTYSNIVKNSEAYQSFSNAIRKVITAVQDELIGISDALKISKLREETVNKLIAGYNKLQTLEKSGIPSEYEKLKILEEQKKTLQSIIKVIAGTDIKLDLGKLGIKETNLTPIEAIKKEVLNLTRQIEKIKTQTIELKIDTDEAKLIRLEEKLRNIRQSLEKEKVTFKFDFDYVNITDNVNKAVESLNKYRSALKELYSEQLKNKNVSNKQRQETLKNIVSVTSEIEAINRFKTSIRSLNTYLSRLGTDIKEFFTSPKKIILSTDTKSLTGLKSKLEDVFSSFEQLKSVSFTTDIFKNFKTSVLSLENKLSLLKESISKLQDVVKNSEAYDNFLNALKNTIKGIQDETLTIEEAINITKLKDKTIQKLASSYERLASLERQLPAESYERLKILEEQKKILRSIIELAGKEQIKLNITGLENIDAVKQQFKSIVTEIEKTKLTRPELTVETDVSKLIKLEDVVNRVKKEVSSERIKFTITDDFESVVNSINKLLTVTNKYKNALNKLYTEQLKNSEVTDEQKVTTLKELNAVNTEIEAVNRFKQNLKSLNDVLVKNKTSLQEFFSSPEEVLASFEGRALDMIKERVNLLINSFRELGNIRPKTTVFDSFVKQIDTLKLKISDVKTSIENLSKIDYGKLRLKNEEEILKKLDEEYNKLMAGGNVLKHWTNMQNILNEALKTGIVLNEKTLSVLYSEEKVYRKLIDYAKNLINTIKNIPVSDEIKKSLVGQLENVYSAITKTKPTGFVSPEMKNDIKMVGSELSNLMKEYSVGAYAGLDKLREKVKSIQKEIFVTSKQLFSITSSGQESYAGILNYFELTLKYLKEWRDVEEKIYRDAGFLKDATLQDVKAQKQRIIEIEQFIKLLSQAESISSKIHKLTLKAGVSPEELSTIEGFKKLAKATEAEPKIYVGIAKANKELKNVIAAVEDFISKSEVVKNLYNKDILAGFKKAAVTSKEVEKILSSLEGVRERQARREAGTAILDIFRLNWFIQLRLFWQAYMFIGRLNTESIEFLHTLKLIGAMTQSSSRSVEALTSSLFELGNAVGYSMSELAKQGLEIAKAGFTVEETTKILTNAAKLAYATGSELSVASDVLITIIKAWNYEVSETENISNKLFATITNTKASLDGLKTAISYVAGIAPKVNASLSDVLAMLGALSNSGLQASKTGTYLRQFLTELVDPSKKFTEAVHKAGLSLLDVDIKSNNLIKILSKLNKSGFSVAEAFSTMNIRAASAFSVLLKNIDVVQRLSETIDSQKNLIEAFGESTESLKGNLDRLVNFLTIKYSEIMNNITPVIQGVLNSFKDLVGGLADGIIALTGWLNKLSKENKVVVSRFTELVTVLGVLTSAFLLLRQHLPKIIGLLALLQTSINPTNALLFSAALVSVVGVLKLTITETETLSFELDSLYDKIKNLQNISKERLTLRLKMERGFDLAAVAKEYKDFYDNLTKQLENASPEMQKAILSDVGLKLQVRAFMSSLAQKLISYPDTEMKKLGQKILDNMLPLDATEERVNQTLNLIKGMSDKILPMIGSITQQYSKTAKLTLDESKNTLKDIDSIINRTKSSFNEVIGMYRKLKLYKGAEKLSEFVVPPVFKLGTKVSTENIKREYSKASKDFVENITKSISLIDTYISSLPRTKKSLPIIENLKQTVAEFQMELRKAIEKGNELFNDKQLSNLNSANTKLSSINSKLKMLSSQIKLTEQDIVNVSNGVQKYADNASKLIKTALIKELDVLLKDLKSKVSKFKALGKLVLLSPGDTKVVASYKKELADIIKTQSEIMAGTAKLPLKFGDLTSTQLETIFNNLKNMWTALFEDLKRTSSTGIVTFNQIINAAKTLHNQPGIKIFDFDGLMKTLGIAKQAIQQLKAEASTTQFDTLDTIDKKVKKITTALGFVLTHKRAFTLKDINSVVSSLSKLIDVQNKFIETIIKARNNIDLSLNYYVKLKTALDDYVYSSKNITDANVMIESSLLNQLKLLEDTSSSVGEVTKSYDGLLKKLELLKNAAVPNIEATKLIQKEYATLGIKASSVLTNLADKLKTVQEEISNLRKKLTEVREESEKIKFDWTTKIEDIKLKFFGPEYEFTSRQNKLLSQGKYINNLIKMNAPIETIVNELKSFRDELLTFAKDYLYQPAGQEALNRAKDITNALMAYQKAREAVIQAQLNVQMNLYTVLSKMSVTIVKLLNDVKKVLIDIDATLKGKKPTVGAGKVKTISKEVGVAELKTETATGKVSAENTLSYKKAKEQVAKGISGPEAQAIGNIDYSSLEEYDAKLMESIGSLKEAKNTLDSMKNSLQAYTTGINRQEVAVLSAVEAFRNYTHSLGTINSTIQNTFNSMMNTIKGTIVSTMMAGLKKAFEGEDIDWYALFSAFYYKIMDAYFNMLVNIMFQYLGSNMTFSQLGQTLFGQTTGTAVITQNLMNAANVFATSVSSASSNFQSSVLNASTQFQRAGIAVASSLQNAAAQIQSASSSISIAATQMQTAAAQMAQSQTTRSIAPLFAALPIGGSPGMSSAPASSSGGPFSSLSLPMPSFGSFKGGLISFDDLPGFATGGFTGKVEEGTTTKDSVLVKLARNEYVVNNSVVKELGVKFFDYINSKNYVKATEFLTDRISDIPKAEPINRVEVQDKHSSSAIPINRGEPLQKPQITSFKTPTDTLTSPEKSDLKFVSNILAKMSGSSGMILNRVKPQEAVENIKNTIIKNEYAKKQLEEKGLSVYENIKPSSEDIGYKQSITDSMVQFTNNLFTTIPKQPEVPDLNVKNVGTSKPEMQTTRTDRMIPKDFSREISNRIEVINITEPNIARRYLATQHGKAQIKNIVNDSPEIRKIYTKF